MYYDQLHSIRMQILDALLNPSTNFPEVLRYPSLMSQPGLPGAFPVLPAKFVELQLN